MPGPRGHGWNPFCAVVLQEKSAPLRRPEGWPPYKCRGGIYPSRAACGCRGLSGSMLGIDSYTVGEDSISARGVGDTAPYNNAKMTMTI